MQYLRDTVAQAFFLSNPTASTAAAFDLERLDNTLFKKYEAPGFLAQALSTNQIPASPETKSAVILLAEMLSVRNPNLPVFTLVGTAARYARNVFFPPPAAPPAA
jgi:hypothetical protein